MNYVKRETKAWFRRRISHAPNRISQFGACEMRRLNQFEATQMNNQLNVGSVASSTDPVEDATEVRYLI